MAQQQLGAQPPETGARIWGYLAAAVALLLGVAFFSQIGQVLAQGQIYLDLEWAPSLGIGLYFMLDGLSLVFSLLISGIGALIFLYATGYMGAHKQFGRFVLYLFGFMLSMLGLVLARDLITLFVFWELTSVTSWLLIGFTHEDAKSRRNALQALLVTGAGGLAALAGFILLGHAAGSFDLAQILAQGSLVAHPLYTGILVLVLLGAFTKSAQFPFHFWLPGAMAAPTPVSAYLHSATMVKAGVYLLARLHPVLSDSMAWAITLGVAGAITTVLGAVLAFGQRDLKQALAYTTLMALGMITLMLSGSSAYALTAALGFLIVHSLYKAALFMVVGAVDHATHSRDIAQLSGLRQEMPITACACVLAAASMAGLPPFIGWIGKELLYMGAPDLAWPVLMTAAALMANALVFGVSFVFIFRVFGGAPSQVAKTAHEAPFSMWIGPLLLSLLGLVFGLMPWLIEPLLAQAVKGSLAAPKAAALHLWGGFNAALYLSLATFVLGICLGLFAPTFRRSFAALSHVLPSFDRGWDRFLDGFKAFAAWQARVIQTGRLSDYLGATFVVLALSLMGTLLLKRPIIAFDLSTAPLAAWLVAAFVIFGAVLAMNPHSRIANICGIGTIGLGVALIFISYGAPDVATTQLMVETLSAVLFGVAMLRLPGVVERRSKARQAWHGIIAVIAGAAVTLVILAIIAHPLDRHITQYFEDFSYTMAHGLNIVNVILVDFRAFDTFGELTVVFLASVGAFVLLKRRVGPHRIKGARK